LYSLSVNVETNLLSLVSPWLDNFYQITTKSATGNLHTLYNHLNTPLGRIPAGFGSCGFGFGDSFSPTVFGFVFRFGIGFSFGFGFPPMDIQWISEINHLELKLMFYNMLIITCLLRLLNLFKINSWKYLLLEKIYLTSWTIS
jgi:hypothetical protein